jgi:short-subunit dehydrogenase
MLKALALFGRSAYPDVLLARRTRGKVRGRQQVSSIPLAKLSTVIDGQDILTKSHFAWRRPGGWNSAPMRSPRVVVITGGSSGLGRCTAALFARNGWNVGLIARGAVGLAASAADVQALGSLAVFAVADVTDSSALGAAARAIADALGPPAIWINCAGNGVYGSFVDVPETDFERVTAVTYSGTVNGCRIALSMMATRGAGTIVNVCSATAFHGLPLMSSYAGAKAAVRGFSQALRAELRIQGSGIRVSTVFPPAVNTPFFVHSVSHMGCPARPARAYGVSARGRG